MDNIINENSHRYFSNKRKIKQKRISFAKKMILYSFIFFWTLISLYPFIWTFAASLRPSAVSLSGGLNPFDNPNLSFDNYKYLFQNEYGDAFVFEWIQNSLTYAIGNSIINLFFNFLTGYALSKIYFKGRKQIFWYLVILMFIPAQITQIPAFLILAKMGLLPKYNDIIWFTGIFIGSSINTYLIFMVRQFFKNNNSQVHEAARIDGLSSYSVYFRVVLRTMIPLIATQFSIVFMWSWNNFLMFRLYAGIDEHRQTIVTGLTAISSSGMDPHRWGKVMAASNLTFAPVIAVYALSLYFQKKNKISGDK